MSTIRNKQNLPKALPKFTNISRYWDAGWDAVVAKILPGEFYVTLGNEGVSTVLGSCISACVRDISLNIGGMNHFMLPSNREPMPEANGKVDISAANRYGNFAMESLINEILNHGGKRRNLEVKVVGGGRILEKMTNIGQMNINFIYTYLKNEELKVASEDVGDIFPRKVLYFPATGRLLVKRLRSLHSNTIADRENSYIKKIENEKVGGDIELF